MKAEVTAENTSKSHRERNGIMPLVGGIAHVVLHSIVTNLCPLNGSNIR
jgi:hypothetical protein